MSARGDDSAEPTYERDIKPLFAKRCVVCHKASKRHDPDISGGLALDSLEAVLAGTDRARVVVPGRSGDSELVRRLADQDDERRMPLHDAPLIEPQQELVRRWIDAGAQRGILAQPPGAAIAGAGAPARRARPRRERALDVIIPTDIKLAPGTLGAPAGGILSLVAAIGPLPPVTSLAFRGDDRLLAVGTYGTVVLWDIHDGRPAGMIGGIPGAAHALALSRDGRRLAIGAGLPARSGVVRVYSVPDGTLLHDFEGHDDVVFAVALRPDGAQLASASFDQTVRFWNLGSARQDGVFRGHSDFVYAVAFTPDGRSLLTASKDRTIKRIDTRTFKEKRTYSGHDQDVLALAVHPDGKRFVSAGNEPQLRWWAFDGERPQAQRGGHSGPVQQLAFSSDGQRLISTGGDRSVRLWDGQSGQPIRQLAGPTAWQYAVALSGDGRLAAAGGWDGVVRLWETESGRLRALFVQSPAQTASLGLAAEPPRIGWLVVGSGGHVAGDHQLIDSIRWRAGALTLPNDAVQAVCHQPELVARAVRGEPIAAVSFPTKQGK